MFEVDKKDKEKAGSSETSEDSNESSEEISEKDDGSELIEIVEEDSDVPEVEEVGGSFDDVLFKTFMPHQSDANPTLGQVAIATDVNLEESIAEAPRVKGEDEDTTAYETGDESKISYEADFQKEYVTGDVNKYQKAPDAMPRQKDPDRSDSFTTPESMQMKRKKPFERKQAEYESNRRERDKKATHFRSH